MAKVMLVEDDHVMVDLLNTLLGIEGFEVVSLNNEGEFLQTVHQNRPDLILLDVNLHGVGNQDIDGFDLLRQIREDAGVNTAKVVMTSGMDYEEKSKQRGADGFILKPYMPTDLISLIKELITS